LIFKRQKFVGNGFLFLIRFKFFGKQQKLISGKVDILVNSQESRDHFLVHGKYLDIDNSKLFRWTGSHRIEIPLQDVFKSDKNEFIVFKTNEVVDPGNYSISISKLNKSIITYI